MFGTPVTFDKMEPSPTISSTGISQQSFKGCGLCKTEMTVTSKCFECDLLLCENCRTQHQREDKSHKLNYVKDMGLKFEVSSVQTFNVDSIGYIQITCFLPDTGNNVWIGCFKSCELYHMNLGDKDFTLLKETMMRVCSMARVSKKKAFISSLKSKLRLLDTETGEITGPIYNVDPFKTLGIEYTKEDHVIIGTRHENGDRYAVMRFDKNWTRLAVYEHDQHGQPIFNEIFRLTSTSNGYIHVVDYIHKSDGDNNGGSVVVLDNNGCVASRYKGHPEVNTKYPFRPDGIAVSPEDRVIVADTESNALHVLDNTGQFVAFIDTKEKGILEPSALAFMDDGHLLISWIRRKIHKVKINAV